jgi:uncharacterized protein (DUF1697 family)
MAHCARIWAAMTVSIALLRGINVGGNRKIPMADLRAVFVAAGCERVTTYIQSGNVVFSHRDPPSEELATELSQHIERRTGFDVPVILRSARQLADLVDNSPYPDAEPTKLFVTFLRAERARGAVAGLELGDFAPESLVLARHDAYVYLPDGAARAKLPQVLARLDPATTARNWRTVEKLLELASR